jgi:hypothetical protein
MHSAPGRKTSTAAEFSWREYESSRARQHFLYFLPLPQGQGSFRETPRFMGGYHTALLMVRNVYGADDDK